MSCWRGLPTRLLARHLLTCLRALAVALAQAERYAEYQGFELADASTASTLQLPDPPETQVPAEESDHAANKSPTGAIVIAVFPTPAHLFGDGCGVRDRAGAAAHRTCQGGIERFARQWC